MPPSLGIIQCKERYRSRWTVFLMANYIMGRCSCICIKIDILASTNSVVSFLERHALFAYWNWCFWKFVAAFFKNNGSFILFLTVACFIFSTVFLNSFLKNIQLFLNFFAFPPYLRKHWYFMCLRFSCCVPRLKQEGQGGGLLGLECAQVKHVTSTLIFVHVQEIFLR